MLDLRPFSSSGSFHKWSDTFRNQRHSTYLRQATRADGKTAPRHQKAIQKSTVPSTPFQHQKNIPIHPRSGCFGIHFAYSAMLQINFCPFWDPECDARLLEKADAEPDVRSRLKDAMY